MLQLPPQLSRGHPQLSSLLCAVQFDSDARIRKYSKNEIQKFVEIERRPKETVKRNNLIKISAALSSGGDVSSLEP